MAQVCRSTWGDTFLADNDGQRPAADDVYLLSIHWTASALSACPRIAGKTGSVAMPPRSRSQVRSTALERLAHDSLPLGSRGGGQGVLPATRTDYAEGFAALALSPVCVSPARPNPFGITTDSA